MATGGLSPTERKEKDFRHTCSLCMEPYRGRHPKLLPCFHTFCLPCLTALEESVLSAMHDAAVTDDRDDSRWAQEAKAELIQAKRDDDTAYQTEDAKAELAHAKSDDGGEEAQPLKVLEGTSPLNDATVGSGGDDDDVTVNPTDVNKASFPCPTCRTPVPIPKGGVSSLQTNFYLDHEPGPDEYVPSALCDMCEEDNRQPATEACQDCPRSMCRPCRRHHDMLTRDHHVTPVGLGQPAAQGKGERRGLCLVHQDQALCFHCRACDVSICLHCKVTSHEGHETVDLTRAALQARVEIMSLIPSAQQQLQAVDTSLQRVERQDRALTRHAQDLTRQIQARRDRLTTWVDRWHERLLEDVRVREDRARGCLRGEKARGMLTRDALSSVLSRAARASAADPQVLTCRKELKAAMLSQDQLLRHQQRANDDNDDNDENDDSFFLRCRYDVTDASVLQEDDVRAYMGQVVEGEGVDAEAGEVGRATSSYVSLRELASRVERLTKETTENSNILASQINACVDDVTGLQKKGDDLEKKGDDLEKKGDELEKKVEEMQKKGEEMQKKREDLEKKGDELEKKGDDLEKKGDELEKKVEEMQKKGEEMQKKREEMQKKGDALEKKTAWLTDEITTSRKTEAELQKTTQSILNKSQKARQLFFVRELDKDKTEEDKAMIFKRVKTNKGGHFDEDTGVFTAPEAGIYSFSATVQSETDKNTLSRIMIDDNLVCCFQGCIKGTTGSVLQPLTTGQKVWVKAHSPVKEYGDWPNYNTFSGTLVVPFL